MLWAKTNNRPDREAPNLSDGALDSIVAGIVVEHEQIGPNRYIAQLGVLFDRGRAGADARRRRRRASARRRCW